VLGTGDQTVDAAGAGEACIGIAMETATAQDATDGRVIAVAVAGTAVWEADEAITIGNRLVSSADGQAAIVAAATAEQEQVGIALTAAANAGEWITVLLTIGTQIDTS
jgi:hypothetical protein